jgi:hypothetical protein
MLMICDLRSRETVTRLYESSLPREGRSAMFAADRVRSRLLIMEVCLFSL